MLEITDKIERVEVSDSKEMVDPQNILKKERTEAKKAVKKLLEAQNQDYDAWLHEQHLNYLKKIKSAFHDIDAILKEMDRS